LHEFTYVAPSSVEEIVQFLAQHREKARPFCGGTDILVQMRSGVRRPSYLLDVKTAPETRLFEFDPAKGLRIGAAVPCADVSADPAVRRYYPGLAEAANLIGSVQIRNRASLGGNLANASPAADTVPALIALGAKAVLRSVQGQREVPVEGFVTAPGRTILNADEVITEFVIPPPQRGGADAYLRFVPRNEMDIAVAGVGVFVKMEGQRCVEARIVLGAVGPTQIVASEAMAYLRGRTLNEGVVSHAAELAAQAASPIDDVRGTREFRRHLVAVLTRRSLLAAAKRAQANQS